MIDSTGSAALVELEAIRYFYPVRGYIESLDVKIFDQKLQSKYNIYVQFDVDSEHWSRLPMDGFVYKVQLMRGSQPLHREVEKIKEFVENIDKLERYYHLERII